jgi:hypothetical protein
MSFSGSVRMKSLFFIFLFLFSCSLSERNDFLIGRDCEGDRDCETGERCLPHDYVNDRYEDLRCRSRASFEPTNDREPPIAYCDEAREFFCPGDLECNADRVRLDATARRRVCKLPGDIFSPPVDGGT